MLNKLRAIMSLNNNQWGRKGEPHNAPPDLDAMWQNFSKKLKRYRRPGDGGGTPSGGGFDFLSAKIIVLVLAVLLGLWLATGFYVVDASERAVVTRLGRFIHVAAPGLRWSFPYPIDRHEIYNVSGVRTIEVASRGSASAQKGIQMLTDDENIVDIQFSVQFNIKDVQDFAFNNQGMSRGSENFVAQVAASAMREVIGKSKMDFVLYQGREQIASEAHRLMQEVLDLYGTGISVSKVNMQNAQPPEEVQEAFNDAVKAVQDKARKKNEGQAYANDILPKARGSADRLIEEAQGYHDRVIAVSEGDVQRFVQVYDQYKRAPSVTRQRIYFDTMQSILSRVKKIIVDAPNSTPLIYLQPSPTQDAKTLEHFGTSGKGSADDLASSASSLFGERAVAADVASRNREALRQRNRINR